MAFLIIDRRLNGRHKSAVNRRRFLKRYRKHIKTAVADVIKKRSITDIERGESISIPRKDISEPEFHHGNGGRQTRVLPGNKEFIAGDRIKRPSGTQGGGGGNGDASDSGEGMDDFIFELTQDEFLDFVFQDLELPNLVKKQLKDSDSYKRVKGGYTKDGIPARLNVLKSLRSAYARRIALTGVTRKKIRELETKLAGLEKNPDKDLPTQLRIKALREDIEQLQRRLKKIPFLDEFDLKYNNILEQPTPTTSAVMFCLMDVSGSMTQEIKDIAKRFFILLYLFLKRNYQKIEVVFIRHHTRASEVEEEEFFYSRETGGTIVSSALELMQEIIADRYPVSDWNIYVAQASDGDNWADDSPHCGEILRHKVLPLVQYFTYVEITPREHQALWHAYENLLAQFPDQFAMEQIEDQNDIYPVFRELFKRKAQ